MTDDELNALVERLEAGLEGVTPGPWEEFRGSIGGYIEGRYEWSSVATAGDVDRENPSEKNANSRHIANCDPDTIRALLSAIRQLMREREWRPIETELPPERKTILLIARYPTIDLWSDAWVAWLEKDKKTWARWPHSFPPTHWRPLTAPPGQS